MSEGADRSALHWAAMTGDLRAFNEALADGDDPNEADDGGWTPLITAASAGHSQIVNALLEAGANPKLTTKDGRSAFFYAVARAHAPVVDLFLQNDICDWKRDATSATALHRAICCAKTTPELLAVLKRAGAPFDAADGDGNLPIHLACYEGRSNIIKWLVDNVSPSVMAPPNAEGKAPQELLPMN
jgi:26S proteasome non-ATPase regulatory subunit 10